MTNQELTIRTMTVLNILNIVTLEQLKEAELPKVNTVLTNSIFRGIIIYTKRVDDELKDFIYEKTSIHN